jgi:hypothetical protein
MEGILTAAVSTPVGPPPHTTKLRRRFLSSGVVVGRLAISKLSVVIVQPSQAKYDSTCPKFVSEWLAHRQSSLAENNCLVREHHAWKKWSRLQL